jgi:hypothetical protein
MIKNNISKELIREKHMLIRRLDEIESILKRGDINQSDIRKKKIDFRQCVLPYKMGEGSICTRPPS